MTLQHPGPGRAGRFVSPYYGAQAVELAQDTKRSTKILFKSANSRERNGLRLPTPPDPRRERPGEVPANLADAAHDVRYCNALASVTRFILVIHHIIVPRMQQRDRGAPRTSSTLRARPSVVFRYVQVPDISCYGETIPSHPTQPHGVCRSTRAPPSPQYPAPCGTEAPNYPTRGDPDQLSNPSSHG